MGWKRMSENEADIWQGLCLAAAAGFASRCAELYSQKPSSEPPLTGIINTLMTELWDRNFSQTEIRDAFEAAIRDMPRYCAGENRRSVISTKPFTQR
jgi:hypothetical protein